MLIKIDDVVEVVYGNDRGARGKVLKVLGDKNKIIVQGVNQVKKHVRRSQRNPRGGRLEMEMPIDASNVQLIDPTTGQPTRVGVRILADGSKERYSKKSSASMGEISPPKEARKKLAT
jgi:large subunit ribosomal protein L24